MSQMHRFAALVFLPVLTLGLGWQLGARVERQKLDETRQRLEQLYGGGVGSGQLVTNPEKQVDISLMWGVWRLLIENYIDPAALQPTPLLHGAVRGLVNAIEDPYTVFMTPKENREFQQSLHGELQGIGAELAIRKEKIVVVAPIKGSPAEKAGLLPEDVIIAVNDESMEGKSLQEVVDRIRGKKGTSVTLTVDRGSKPAPLTFTIVRDDIRIPSVESETKESKGGPIGVITINQFGSETIDEVERAIRKMDVKRFKGMILDLRFNGGGYLDGAVSLTSLVLREGKVVSVEGRTTSPQLHYVTGNPLLPDMPLVILINEGTASASEIVAGALQDHKRATIIGMKSFGKGTVQEVIDLPGGSSLRVTTAHWLTPNGRNLGKEGVTPDIKVERTPEDIEAKKDPQMDKAIEFLVGGF